MFLCYVLLWVMLNLTIWFRWYLAGFSSSFPFIIYKYLIFRLPNYTISHRKTTMWDLSIVIFYLYIFFYVYELNSTEPSPMLSYLRQYRSMNIYFILWVIIHHYQLFSDIPIIF